RARLCTTPAVTGSLTWTNTVGVVRVVSLTATVTGVELVRITSDRKSSSSLAAQFLKFDCCDISDTEPIAAPRVVFGAEGRASLPRVIQSKTGMAQPRPPAGRAGLFLDPNQISDRSGSMAFLPISVCRKLLHYLIAGGEGPPEALDLTLARGV